MGAFENPSPEHQDVNELEAAQLALRGAVASLRSLQDVHANLKAELQDMMGRERAWKQRAAELENHVIDLQAKWKAAQRTQEDYREQYAAHIRSEVALEEQTKWQAQFDELQKTLVAWRAAGDERDQEMKKLQAMLSQRDADVTRLSQEKTAIELRASEELAQVFGTSRAQLSAAVNKVVEEKNKELAQVRAKWLHESEELRGAWMASEAELENKQDHLERQYHERRRELEALWVQREQEAWVQAEASRGQIELALRSSFRSASIRWKRRKPNFRRASRKN